MARAYPALLLLAALLRSSALLALAAKPQANLRSASGGPPLWGKRPALAITLPTGGACVEDDSALLGDFLFGGASATGAPLTRAQAAAVSCQLGLLMEGVDADDVGADDLFFLYKAWRQAYRPHVWRTGKGNGVNTRLPIWAANLRTIVDLNADPAAKFWAAPNAYSDITWTEFAGAVLMSPAASADSTEVATPLDAGGRRLMARLTPIKTASTNVDWVAANKVVRAVGFQASCASSWAWATAAAVECKLLLSTKTTQATIKPLSPQSIMDCTTRAFNLTTSPCAGGSVPQAFELIAARGIGAAAGTPYRPQNGGADTDALGFQLKCDREPSRKQAQSGVVRITSTPAYTQVAATKAGLIQALASQPAVVVMSVEPSFQHYAGGVWSGAACSAESPTHALLVVGFDARTAPEYWSVKNSFGAGWGQSGFGKVAMTTDGVCGMYQAVYQSGAVEGTTKIA